MFYLYLKRHQITGLKYLGFTSQNPFKYKGSGNRWINHINKHGNNVSTQILLVTKCKKDIKNTGLFFSKLWNIVESKEYANLIVESGSGFQSGYQHPMYMKSPSKSTKQKLSIAKLGKTLPDKTKYNMFKACLVSTKRSKHPVAVEIDGSVYRSIGCASRVLKVHVSTIRKRIDSTSTKFKHYKRIGTKTPL